jgi:hypothetical protein
MVAKKKFSTSTLPLSMQPCIFDQTVKITKEKSGTFMVVAFEPTQAPIGDVYCFTNVEDLIEFLAEQGSILQGREQ